MSDDLYSTRLRWTRARGGVALMHGVRVQLPPEVPPLDLGRAIECLDYTPEVGVRVIQPVGDRQDDMTQAEVEACDAYLRRVCAKESVR